MMNNEQHTLAASAAPVAPFQIRVQPWMMACFGAEIAADGAERNHRFLEESLELVQACGCTASEAHQLVDYVYGRPVGEPHQEVGGVMVTLAALCLAQGLDMHAAGETELNRIWTKVEAIRAKQAAKPKHSPLPAAAPQVAADERAKLHAAAIKAAEGWVSAEYLSTRSIGRGGPDLSEGVSKAEERARNAISALAVAQVRAHPVAVPDGWKLVPAEPTEHMMHAAQDIPAPRPYGEVYRAMLSVAPATSVAQQDAIDAAEILPGGALYQPLLRIPLTSGALDWECRTSGGSGWLMRTEDGQLIRALGTIEVAMVDAAIAAAEKHVAAVTRGDVARATKEAS